MNGVERIRERLNEEASQEINEIIQKAKAEAAKIKANYKAQANEESKVIIARGKKAAEERKERNARVAVLEAKKVTLAAKQAMISKAFDRALEQMCDLPEEQYIELLAGIAAKAAESKRESVVFNKKDRNRVGKAVVTRANELLGDGRLTVETDAREFTGGLILSSGDIEVNGTFETLLHLRKAELAAEVAHVLFDQ
jgi:V/A-type H+-transporting ATPase subunit E